MMKSHPWDSRTYAQNARDIFQPKEVSQYIKEDVIRRTFLKYYTLLHKHVESHIMGIYYGKVLLPDTVTRCNVRKGHIPGKICCQEFKVKIQ